MIVNGTIQTWAIQVLEEKITKLNKRAEKCGCEPMKVNVLNVYEKENGKDNFGNIKMISVADVEVTGDIPRINGWYLRAVVTPAEGTDYNFVKSAGDQEELDKSYRTIDMRCDHCKHNRRRKDVFVIKNDDTGEERVIGRNCLADFCRTGNPEAMVAHADWISQLSGELGEDYGCDLYDGPRGRYLPETPIQYFIETVSIFVRKLGWLSRGAAIDTEESTASQVGWFLWTPDTGQNGKDKESLVQRKDLHITDFDKELAAEALAWARNISRDVDNDYLYNLALACQSETVNPKASGLVASLIVAYKRAREQEIKRREFEKASGNKEWVGELGVRIRGLELTVVGTSSHDSVYGVKTFIRFKDANENSVVWSASGDKTEDFTEGSTYVVDATPKKHDKHATFGKQTFVNRVTIKKELAA
jgi:hypothetical protein